MTHKRFCTRCAKTTDFNNSLNCLPCKSEYQKEYNKKNYEKVKVAADRYRRSKRGREILRASANKYRKSLKGRAALDRQYFKWTERSYGVSKEKYSSIFELQNGNCAICNKNQSDLKNRLCVDHCHKTNRVRGLLCSACNRHMGGFKDDSNYLKSVIDYLGRY